MSRLIDADKLKEKAFGGRRGLINTSDLDNAPTVEAIPIEWIEMRIAPLYWTVEGRKIQEVAYWLIDEWEEWKREQSNE